MLTHNDDDPDRKDMSNDADLLALPVDAVCADASVGLSDLSDKDEDLEDREETCVLLIDLFVCLFVVIKPE